MQPRSLILAALFAGTVAGNASAQRAGTVEVAALGVWHNKTTTLNALRGMGAGARLGIWLPANFELEGQVDLTFPQSGDGDRFKLLYFAGSALFNIPLASGPSLYLRAGYGKLSPQGCEYRGVACPSHAAATGAAGLRIPVGGSVSIRAEAMYRTRPAYDYSSFGASLGFTVLRGRSGGESSQSGPDADADGVPNGRDRCKDTPRGALVDSRGCPSDLDQDGVLDGIDRCPATPAGTSVDGVGCPIKKPE